MFTVSALASLVNFAALEGSAAPKVVLTPRKIACEFPLFGQAMHNKLGYS